jgi:hypothetical protein
MDSSRSGAVSRRHVVRLACGAAAGGVTAAIAPPSRAEATRLAGLFRDGASASRVGHRYLATLASDADRTTILAASPALEPVLRASRRGAAALLRQAVAEDFQRGNTVVVDGWVLAAAEARLCALVALG